MMRLCVLLFVGCLLLPGQTLAASSGTASAAAESLYRQANQLMSEGKFAEACPKYEASQRLDRALGTMLRLADCWDRVGRSASAWALFLESATWAAKSGEPERESIARKRAEALEPRLTKVTLKSDGKLPVGYEIKLAGAAVDPAVWSTPIPVDPGELTLEASAPGHEPLELTVEIEESSEPKELLVPRLEALPPAVAKVPVSEVTPHGRTWQKPTGLALVGVGLAGLAGGGTLGILAMRKNNQSKANCTSDDANLCNEKGVEQRNKAQTYALGANVAMGVGGGLLATGVLVLLLSKKRNREAEHLNWTPQVHKSGGGVVLRGVF